MPLLVYTLLRLAVLAVCLVAGYLLGLRGWLLAAAVIVVAALVSYLALPRQRAAAAVYLADRAQRRSSRFAAGLEADAQAEDGAAEAQRRPARGAATAVPRERGASDVAGPEPTEGSEHQGGSEK